MPVPLAKGLRSAHPPFIYSPHARDTAHCHSQQGQKIITYIPLSQCHSPFSLDKTPSKSMQHAIVPICYAVHISGIGLRTVCRNADAVGLGLDAQLCS
jgi:hypothetical protein